MRYGYWLPVFGGWLRNIADEREVRARAPAHRSPGDVDDHVRTVDPRRERGQHSRRAEEMPPVCGEHARERGVHSSKEKPWRSPGPGASTSSAAQVRAPMRAERCAFTGSSAPFGSTRRTSTRYVPRSGSAPSK